MNFKKSLFAIHANNLRDFDRRKEYPTIADLMKEQGTLTNLEDTWDKECELNPSNKRCLVYDD